MSRSMPGTTPLVLMVMCRAPRPNRSVSLSASAAASTASVLSSGSPMPMNTMLVTRWPSADHVAPPEQRLVDDLGGIQVTPEAQLARGTERAADRAAGLGRDAQRGTLSPTAARGIAHEHRFDGPPVIQAMERLLGQAAVRTPDRRCPPGVEPGTTPRDGSAMPPAAAGCPRTRCAARTRWRPTPGERARRPHPPP